ncbi:MAG: YqgE/AlgH family protein [Dehalococcoidia bacterium]
MIGSLAGRLLVATPLLGDANFARTVILMCAHDEQGGFGLVLNRPLGEPVALHLPEWSARTAEPSVFFVGGPVQRNVVMALGRFPAAGDADWWTRVTAEVGLIDLRGMPGDLEGVTGSARLFVGYAGWGAGQLEGEIAEEAWWVLDARAGDAFTSHPATLWRDVLRRQRGRLRDLRLYANYPPDARLN